MSKRALLREAQEGQKKPKIFSSAKLFDNQENWLKVVNGIRRKGGYVDPIIASFIKNKEVNILHGRQK